MKRYFGTYLVCFMIATVMAAYALPTMAGRLKSYDGSTGILVLELEDKSIKKFKLTDKTTVEWMGRNTSAGAIRAGSKVSVQIAGALNANPLVAAKIVDWSNSDKIVAKGAAAPYHTPVAQYASTDGGGGMPDGAPKMNSSAHQTMAAIGHGGSENQPRGPVGPNAQAPTSSSPGQAYPAANTGTTHYNNQGTSMTAPLEMMNIDPYNTGTSSQMGMGQDYNQMGMGQDYNQMGMDYNQSVSPDAGTLMGNDEDGDSSQGVPGMDSAYGGSNQRVTGQILESAVERGYVMIQSFEHPTLLRILLHQANAPMQLLVPGQMIEVSGTPTPQGFRAVEIKAAQSAY